MPNLFVQLERHDLKLVLLSAVPFSPQFREGNEAFLTQYASRREAKKNNHYLLTIKMRQDDSLKSFIGYFQSQLVNISNCGEDVSALAFISGLQVSQPLYKY